MIPASRGRNVCIAALLLTIGLPARSVAQAPVPAPVPDLSQTPVPAVTRLAPLLAELARDSEALTAAFEEGAFRAETLVQELDGDGKVKSERRTVDRIEQKDGKPVAHLLEATVDGEDAREKVEAERAERKAKRAEEGKKKRGDFPDPFAAKKQAEYRFTLREAPPGAKTLRIDFAPEAPSKERFVGHALIDGQTHRLRAIAATLSKYPVLLDEMRFSVSFDERAGRPVVTRIVGGGKGGLPLMKKRFQMTARFTEWRFPASGTAPRR